MTLEPKRSSDHAEERAVDRRVLLTVEAPTVPVERFLRLPLGGEALVWDAGEEGAFAARGAAVTIEAEGPARFDRVKLAAERLASSLVLVGETALARRDPRFFGGFAFEPGVDDRASDAASSAASGLGDATFSIGEWTYDTSGTRAILQRVVPERRWRASRTELVREAESVARALADVPPIELAPRAAPAAPREDDGATFQAEVAAATDAIARDRLTKVVLSRRASVALSRPLDVARVVAALRALEPSSTRFVVARGDVVFVGATPERLVTLRRGEVRVDALAGSAPREEGAELALLGSDKDQREHAIVVDALRECLADLVDGLTVEPTTLRTLRSLHHLWTRVSARTRPGVHVLDLVEALHPTPAVSGYPRAAARAWIREREPHTRGWYAAPVGWFDSGGSGSFGVAIRSALVQGLTAWLHAGAGIVAGSEPAREFAETSAKLSPMRDALALAGEPS